jgi:DNA polymerase III epsilon subunit-like protein
MNLLFLDTETTGLGPDARLLQVAYSVDGGPIFSEFFNPGVPLGIDAMCVNHITEKMVIDKPQFKGSSVYTELQNLLSTHTLVAHNASFDIGMLTREDLSVPSYICTKKIAEYLNLAKRSNLQYLRYSLDLDIEGNAHTAGGDVAVLIALFAHITKHYLTPEQMLTI